MKPTRMPRVRITTVLSCPNAHCSRVIYSPSVRYGQLWMKCNVAEIQRRQTCPAHWFNLTLGPGATGLHLVDVVGRDLAWHIMRQVLPPNVAAPDRADELFIYPLAGERDKPVHIQLACRGRDEHHLRYAPLADVIRGLQIVQPQTAYA